MQATRPENSTLKIDQHDKFFSKLLSRESSAANSSSQILYYDGIVRAVPFLWETCPGTPKHLPPSSSYSFDSADTYNSRPCLMPPPCYFPCVGSKFSETGFEVEMGGGRRSFLGALLSMLGQKRSVVSPTWSVSSSKSFSSVASSPPLAQKNRLFRERYGGGHNNAIGQDQGGLLPVSMEVSFGSRRGTNSGRNWIRKRGMCF